MPSSPATIGAAAMRTPANLDHFTDADVAILRTLPTSIATAYRAGARAAWGPTDLETAEARYERSHDEAHTDAYQWGWIDSVAETVSGLAALQRRHAPEVAVMSDPAVAAEVAAARASDAPAREVAPAAAQGDAAETLSDADYWAHHSTFSLPSTAALGVGIYGAPHTDAATLGTAWDVPISDTMRAAWDIAAEAAAHHTAAHTITLTSAQHTPYRPASARCACGWQAVAHHDVDDIAEADGNAVSDAAAHLAAHNVLADVTLTNGEMSPATLVAAIAASAAADDAAWQVQRDHGDALAENAQRDAVAAFRAVYPLPTAGQAALNTDAENEAAYAAAGWALDIDIDTDQR